MKKKSLKELRKNKNLTQEQASKILDITKEYLSMIERGDRNPSDKLKESFAKLYGVSVYDIFLACKETKCFNNN